MEAQELMRRIVAAGGDEGGIRDRFGDNAELYEMCFREFLNGPGFAALREAIGARDYRKAFEAAHALKGLSGNLGATAFYTAIRPLVESLRGGDCENAAAQYAEVEKQYRILENLSANEAAPPAPAAPEKPEPAKPEKPESARPGAAVSGRAPGAKGKGRDLFLPLIIAALLLIVAFVYMLFQQLMTNYEDKVRAESANHLIEINYQIKRYVEDRIESDWMTAYTVGCGIAESNYVSDDEAVLRLMRKLREIWKSSDIILYNEDGYNADVNGGIEANDLASERIDKARKLGSFMTIIDSDITFTVPVETNLRFGGSRIAAVSVVKTMKSFLDDMGFSSFGESASMYLTDGDGKVISRLSNGEATFNVMALFDGSAIASITNRRVDSNDILSAETPTAFITEGNYVVSTPIQTRRDPLRLIYLVSEDIVNSTMNSFSGNVMSSSFVVMIIFASCALLGFWYIYGMRKRQFDSALLAREHMFDLLVKRSRTAFGLFEADQPAPAYISSNAAEVIGEESPTLFREGEGFVMRGGAGADAPTIRQINDSLRGWDGKTEFRSGFILNPDAAPPRYFEMQLFPIGEKEGEYLGIAQDVTRLHEREAATKDALEMAERANEAKTRFLSNMSHDIRTPMNAIVNMADFAIEDLHSPDKLREHLKTIRESSDHLLMLINDILDMSRIESGKAAVESAPFSLRAELQRLRDIVSPLCVAREQTLITDFDGIGEGGVLGDRVKLSQILMNLLSNAIKFTPSRGAVRFTAAQEPSLRENYLDVRFVVEDTGMGISRDFLPHVFEPFAREDAKRVGAVQGTGLGLSICHSYVIAMGGAIKCESEEGEGSSFTVELFFERTDAPPAPRVEAPDWTAAPFLGMRCLVCEDNPTNQRIAKAVLDRLGFQVDLAGDGKEGLTMFEKSPPGRYELIYMDIQMPVMDGYEAAVAIRACGHPQAHSIPIIAMTANVFIEDVEKARLAGMDGHIGKPITTAALLGETSRILNTRRSAFL